MVVAYTSAVNDEGQRSIHFSISQGGYTTAAVGGRFVFLLLRLLHQNVCSANLYKTETTVHHAVFSIPLDQELKIETTANVVADMRNYQDLQISTVSMSQQSA